MVRGERLELSHLAILEPKSSASTNSANPAHNIIYYLKDEIILELIFGTFRKIEKWQG